MAGRRTAPEVMSYLEPWHWHIKVVPVSSPDESGQPSCLHRSSKAYSLPPARATETRRLRSSRIVGVDIVIGQLARVVERAERYCSRHLFHSFLASVEPTDNIDSDWANLFLTKCSKVVYWTLVQYERQRGVQVSGFEV